jgi:hypothetical protein
MRWIYFLVVVLLAVVIQMTVGQILWFRTSVGWIGPVFPAAVAVFAGLHARSGADAALAGWALGFGLDLTLSGEGMGLSALLYALAAGGVFKVREAFFRERILTQMVLGFAFCVLVYELWAAYVVALSAPAGVAFWPAAVQALGLSAYTAVLTPLVCAPLRRLERFLLAAPSTRERR